MHGERQNYEMSTNEQKHKMLASEKEMNKNQKAKLQNLPNPSILIQKQQTLFSIFYVFKIILNKNPIFCRHIPFSIVYNFQFHKYNFIENMFLSDLI